MFFGSFWHTFSYLGSNSSNLTELFKKQNLTLEDILDEDNILTEVKTGGQKFTDHMAKNTHLLKSLIDYVIIEPDVLCGDDKKLFKYPFISSEILGSNVQGLANFLFGEQEDSQGKEGEDLQEEEEDTEDITAKLNEETDKQEDQEPTPEEALEDNKEKEAKEQELEQEQEQELEQEQDKEMKPEDEEDADQEGLPKENPEEDPEKKDEEEQTAEEQKEESNQEESNQEESNQEESNQEESNQKYTGNQLLLQLFSFLETDYPLNPTSAGYFQKAVNLLVNKNGQLSNFIQKHPQIKTNFVNHIGMKSIAEIMQKLIVNDGLEAKDEYFAESRIMVINELIKVFLKSDESNIMENIACILVEVLNCAATNDKNPNKILDPIAEEIYSESNIKLFFDKLEGPITNQGVLQTVSVLNAMVSYFISKINQKSDDMEDDVVISESSENFPLDVFAKNFEILIKVLSDDKLKASLTQHGQMVVPFGLGRLKIIEMMNNFLKCKNDVILEKFNRTNFFKLCFGLLKKFEWNNLLHIYLDKMINTIIEYDNVDLLHSIFDDDKGNLTNFIIELANEEDYKPANRQKVIKHGYIGFAIKISRTINKHDLEKYFSETSQQNWKEFSEDKLKTLMEKEDRTLGDDKKGTEQCEEEISIDIAKIYEKFNTYFTKQRDNNTTDNNDEAQEDYKQNEEEEDIEEEPEIILEKLEEEDENDKIVEMSEYSDGEFWKVDYERMQDIEDLMNDL